MGVIVSPHVIRVLFACFKDDIEVGTHMSDVVSVRGQYSHVGGKAAGPLEEGILHFVALANET